MLLYTSGGMDETIRLASSWNVEGLILLGVQPQEIEKIREWLKMPVVYIDSYYPEKMLNLIMWEYRTMKAVMK